MLPASMPHTRLQNCSSPSNRPAAVSVRKPEWKLSSARRRKRNASPGFTALKQMQQVASPCAAACSRGVTNTNAGCVGSVEAGSVGRDGSASQLQSITSEISMLAGATKLAPAKV